MSEPTPAEIAAQPTPAREPTPAEIAMQGLEPPKAPDAPAAAPVDTVQKVAETATSGAVGAGNEAERVASAVENRYDAQLKALMEKARSAREKQVATQQQQQELELLQKVKLAKELGPDAALKALGLERPKIDIAKLLNPEQDDEPKSVKELKSQISQINQYIEDLKQRSEAENQHRQMQQRQAWEQNELATIADFVEKNKEKFEYVGAAKVIGSDKDIYNGKISMYNQGYSPNNEEMADLVESRIEQLIDLVAPTKKFSDYIGKKFGVQLARKNAASVTLTEGMRAEPAEAVDLNKMTDEENREYALKAALAAKQEALRKLGVAKV
jgi:hypothetical protein